MATIVDELLEAAQGDVDHPAGENARDFLYRLLQTRHPCQ
jgi:hypothetical protein